MLTPEQAVDAINRRFGSHGTRALHAKGTLTRGSFTATPDAARLTRAVHMQGSPVEATVRFSNGSGDPHAPDYGPEVRGMAVKLYLPNGDRTDISAQTVPRFPVRTPDAFINLIRASAPGRARLLRLPLFLATHPEALPALRANAPALKPPVSYASARYYAIHAFKWIDADGGQRYVRYRWVPEASEPSLSPEQAKSRGTDYLQEDIRDRLERGPVRFTLELQIAAPGDKVDDPTAVWPAERQTVAAGTLEVTELETGRETGGDVLVFDPVRVTDGIELSEDPILNYRSAAYSVSIERRT
ncbi:MAG: catalase [Thermoleophilaceae bacterium]|nr:catalase [Thermoleophilaceae bacterium]